RERLKENYKKFRKIKIRIREHHYDLYFWLRDILKPLKECIVITLDFHSDNDQVLACLDDSNWITCLVSEKIVSQVWWVKRPSSGVVQGYYSGIVDNIRDLPDFGEKQIIISICTDWFICKHIKAINHKELVKLIDTFVREIRKKEYNIKGIFIAKSSAYCLKSELRFTINRLYKKLKSIKNNKKFFSGDEFKSKVKAVLAPSNESREIVKEGLPLGEFVEIIPKLPKVKDKSQESRRVTLTNFRVNNGFIRWLLRLRNMVDGWIEQCGTAVSKVPDVKVVKENSGETTDLSKKSSSPVGAVVVSSSSPVKDLNDPVWQAYYASKLKDEVYVRTNRDKLVGMVAALDDVSVLKDAAW
ncbi:MAG: hypothetical protein KAQ85_03820, partial [Thermodesulfovibrionia bacterium]|nr:hypothetical protein [Thermodesulfovibrionia bacterium]